MKYLQLIIVLAIVIGIIYIMHRVGKYFDKKKPKVKIDEKNITNKPEGKGGKDDKKTTDDIGDKYGLDG